MGAARMLGAVVATTVALAAVPAAAEAHTLTIRHARAVAWLKADRYGQNHTDWFDKVTEVTARRRDCLRFTRHQVRCVASVWWETIPGEVYDDGTTEAFCVLTIRVTWPSWSRRARSRIGRANCG